MIKFEVNQQSGPKISSVRWRTWAKKIQSQIKSKKVLVVSVGVVGEGRMKQFNKIYRGKNKSTDVLSFGEKDVSDKLSRQLSSYLGEIILCYPQVVKRAKLSGQSINDEF